MLLLWKEAAIKFIYCLNKHNKYFNTIQRQAKEGGEA